MRLRLAKLQESDKEAQKIRVEGLNRYEELDGILYHQGLPFVSKAIWTKIISWHYNDLLARHFGIDKTKDLIGRKYYWSSLWRDIEAYVKGYDVCLGFKGSQTQALWRPAVFAGTNSLMEGPFNRFLHGVTDFNQLERRKLWLHPDYHWLAYKNGVLWASQGYQRCFRASWGHPKYGNLTPRSVQLNRV